MELKLRKDKNVIVVYLQGRLDVHLIKEIEISVLRLVADETSSHLVFNLKEVEYVSSSGLALFISITRIFKERRLKFILCDLNSSVNKILAVVELTSLFHILKTEEEALEYITDMDLIHSL